MAQDDKLDAYSDALSINNVQPRRLKRTPIILIFLAVIIIIIVAFSFAMLKDPKSLNQQEEKLVTANSNRLPGFIQSGPKDYSQIPKEIPALGPPRDGDLGHAGLPAKTTTFKHPTMQKKGLSDDEQALLEEERQARLADVFVPGVNEAKRNVSQLDPLASRTKKASTIPASLSDKRNAALANLEKRRAAAQKGSSGYQPDLDKLTPQDEWDAQNSQRDKMDFLKTNDTADQKSYLSQAISHPVSPYEVKTGTIIPVTMITGTSSDIPGQLVGQVREHVFDTVTGHYLLIPQGSRVVGQYDSGITFGQERILVVWQRLIMPNGAAVNLEGMPGVDLSGYAGYKDKVDNHWLQLASGVVLSSMLSVGVTSSQGDLGAQGVSLTQSFLSNAGQDLNRTGQKIVERMLNRQPTLTITPGFSVNVFVNKDMILEPYTANKGNHLDNHFATD